MSEAKYIDTDALSAYTEALSKKLARVYNPKGSAIYADAAYLASAENVSPTIDTVGLWQQIDGNWVLIDNVMPGWVFNITNKFTTDSNFIDGADKTVAAGNNIVVVNIGTEQAPVLKFDLLAMGIDLSSINDAIAALQTSTADITDKQDKELSEETEVVIPDYTPADAAARLALTPADGDIAKQQDTEEYYYAEVSGATVTWHDIGNTKTVEGMLKLISSLTPSKPISAAEIQAMFA